MPKKKARDAEYWKKYRREYRKRLYELRKAKGLCVDTGEELPKTYRGKPWNSIRCPKALKALRDRNRRSVLGWDEEKIAKTPPRRHKKSGL